MAGTTLHFLIYQPMLNVRSPKTFISNLLHHQAMDIKIFQKPLFYFLISLILLMIVFSVLSIKDKGQEGYQRCVQKKCDEVSQDFCNKAREQNNCCMGAGGQLAQSADGFSCVFE